MEQSVYKSLDWKEKLNLHVRKIRSLGRSFYLKGVVIFLGIPMMLLTLLVLTDTTTEEFADGWFADVIRWHAGLSVAFFWFTILRYADGCTPMELMKSRLKQHQIHKWQEQNLEELSLFLQEQYRKAFGAGLSADSLTVQLEQRSVSALREMINRGERFYCLWRNNFLVGCVQMRGVTDMFRPYERRLETIELTNLYVACKGRGLGRYLMRHVLALPEYVNKDVMLDVYEHNVPARLLYESLGFQEVGRIKTIPDSDDEDIVLRLER